MGGLELRPSDERKEGLLPQPCLYPKPHHFLQRSTVRAQLYLKPQHRSQVKEGARSHHGFGAPGRMKTRIPLIDTNGSKPNSDLMHFVIIRAISVFGCL